MIPNEAPWIVEIDGIQFATPEAVLLLLKAVSEERDELKKATEKLLHAIVHSPVYHQVKDTYTELRDVVDDILEEE